MKGNPRVNPSYAVVLCLVSACKPAGPPGPARIVRTPSLRAAALAPQQLQNPVLDIDLEGETTSLDEIRPAPGSRMRLQERGRQFRLPLNGSIDLERYVADRPHLVSSLFHGGGANGHSLLMTLPPRPTPTSSDRAELNVYDRDLDSHGVTFDFHHPKYFGFAMYVLETSGLPLETGVHFMQAWQHNVGRDEDGGSCGVPLAATLENAPAGSATALQFHVSASDNGEAEGGHYSVVPPTPLSVGAWHTFLFYLEPNSNELPGEGVVTLWFDGAKVADWRHDWGCNLAADNRGWGPISDDWHLRVGMYRSGRGAIEQYLYVAYDDMRVAFTRADADPTAKRIAK
jgi:hypothetical protein